MRYLSRFLLLITGCWGCTFFYSCGGTTRPQVQFEQVLIDMGKVKQGDSALSTFLFTNKTNKKMRIAQVITDCGCTVSSFDSAYIENGSRGRVILKYHNYSDSGLIKKSAIVKFENDTTYHLLTIKGNGS